METLRNVNEVSLNFNLREPKKLNGSTQVYAVVKVEGKQIKLPINCKVCAWNWDFKRQMPKVTNSMIEEDRANAMQVNSILNDVRMNFFAYLCSGEPITESTLREHLTTNTTMANKNAQPPKTRRQATATKVLNEAFVNLYGTLYKRPFSSHRENFYKFLSLGYYDGHKIYDSVSMLNYEGISLYKKYLENETSNDAVVIIQKLNTIVRLINEVAKTKKYGNIEKMDNFKQPQRPRHEDDLKIRALTQKEKETFLNFDFAKLVESAKGKREKTKFSNYAVYQDVFNMMLASGVRFSDVNKLYSGEYTIIEQNGMEMYVVKTQKGMKKGLRAYIFATPTIKAQQQKYANGLPFRVTETAINEKLKEMFKLCGFTQTTEKYTRYDNNTPIYEQKALCEVIASHWARHTFTTERRAEGWSEEHTDRMTAHATPSKSMTSRYTHLTDEQICNILTREYKRIHEGNKQEPTHNESVNALIAECKDVLMFLGAQYKDIADIDNIDTLMYKCYVEYPQQFKEWGIDVKQIKDIYNTKATFEQKQFALKELLMECEEKELTKA